MTTDRPTLLTIDRPSNDAAAPRAWWRGRPPAWLFAPGGDVRWILGQHATPLLVGAHGAEFYESTLRDRRIVVHPSGELEVSTVTRCMPWCLPCKRKVPADHWRDCPYLWLGYGDLFGAPGRVFGQHRRSRMRVRARKATWPHPVPDLTPAQAADEPHIPRSADAIRPGEDPAARDARVWAEHCAVYELEGDELHRALWAHVATWPADRRPSAVDFHRATDHLRVFQQPAAWPQYAPLWADADAARTRDVVPTHAVDAPVPPALARAAAEWDGVRRALAVDDSALDEESLAELAPSQYPDVVRAIAEERGRLDTLNDDRAALRAAAPGRPGRPFKPVRHNTHIGANPEPSIRGAEFEDRLVAVSVLHAAAARYARDPRFQDLPVSPLAFAAIVIAVELAVRDRVRDEWAAALDGRHAGQLFRLAELTAERRELEAERIAAARRADDARAAVNVMRLWFALWYANEAAIAAAANDALTNWNDDETTTTDPARDATGTHEG